MSSYYAVGIAAFIGVLWLLVALPQRRLNRRHAGIVVGLDLVDRVLTPAAGPGAGNETGTDLDSDRGSSS